jgi:hypothetical protein
MEIPEMSTAAELEEQKEKKEKEKREKEPTVQRPTMAGVLEAEAKRIAKQAEEKKKPRPEFKTIPVIKQIFMEKYTRYEPAARDSTALKAVKECYRKYFFSIVLGFRVPKGGTPIYFPFGSGYHKFREVLEIEYNKFDTPIAKIDCDKCLKPAWEAAKELWPGNPIPGSSKWDYMTEDYLLLSCIAGFNYWKNEKIGGQFEILATEQSFEVVLPNGKSSGGRADQIVRWNGRPWGRDFKTTGQTPEWYEKSQLDPVDQFFRYTHGESGLLGERIEGQLVEVLFHKKATKNDKGKPKIKSFIVSYTPSQIDRWEAEQVVLERQLDICREEDVWPACETFCGRCAYRSVCKAGSERGMMGKLEQNWLQRHWDYKNIVNS